MEANCYCLCFILYKTSCPELLVIVSCRNLGLSRIVFIKKWWFDVKGVHYKRDRLQILDLQRLASIRLVQIKGHRHYLSAEMNITIHSRHSTVSDWLRSPGFFLDHCFVSYV